MPGVKQPWPTVAACWSPAMPRIGDGAAEQRRGDAEVAGAVAHLRQQRRRHAEQLAQLGVPGARADVVEQRARGVGGIGRVCTPRRSAARAGSCRWCRRRAAPPSAAARAPSTWSSSQAILVAEKYGSSTSPVFAVAAASRPCARSRSHNGAVRRSCQTMALWIGLPVSRSQSTRGLALVGNADGRHVLRDNPGLGHAAAHRVHDRLPDLLGIVLDPAGRRDRSARSSRCAGGERLKRGIEHDGPRARSCPGRWR